MTSPPSEQPKQLPVRMLSSSTNAWPSSTTAQNTSSTRSVVSTDSTTQPRRANSLRLSRESGAVLVEQEEGLVEVLADQVDAVERGGLSARALTRICWVMP